MSEWIGCACIAVLLVCCAFSRAPAPQASPKPPTKVIRPVTYEDLDKIGRHMTSFDRIHPK